VEKIIEAALDIDGGVETEDIIEATPYIVGIDQEKDNISWGKQVDPEAADGMRKPSEIDTKGPERAAPSGDAPEPETGTKVMEIAVELVWLIASDEQEDDADDVLNLLGAFISMETSATD
jgi:hypothetical protein